MKISKIREMSSPELEKELGELKSELFKLRFSLATNGLDNPMKIKEVRKDIARVKTELRKREIEEVKFILSTEELGFFNAEKKFVTEPGEFKLFVGNSSDNLKAVSFELIEK